MFFDDLCPPWPKHPCTDSRSIPKMITPAAFPARLSGRAQNYRWQADGWSPFFIHSVSRVDGSILQASGSFVDKALSVFFCKEINLSEVPSQITRESVAYLRTKVEGKYELSLVISSSAGHVTADAFTSLLAARRAASASKEGSREGAVRQSLTLYRRNRAAEEAFLSLVARHEIGGHALPRLPKNLMSRLQSIVASKGGILPWAKSHPLYVSIRAREQSRLRRAAKIRRKIARARTKVATTKWKTKNRSK